MTPNSSYVDEPVKLVLQGEEKTFLRVLCDWLNIFLSLIWFISHTFKITFLWKSSEIFKHL